MSLRPLLGPLLALAIHGVAGADPPAPYVPGEILVKFRPAVGVEARLRLESEVGARPVRRLALIGAELLRLEGGLGVEEAVARLGRDPGVEYAEPNYLVRSQAIPDDPLFPNQYALNNTGQTGGPPGVDIDAPEAWDLTTGDGNLRIAVLDSGVDYTHPDLGDNMWVNLDEARGLDGEDDDLNGYVDDIYGYDFFSNRGDPMDWGGHGSFMAGIIAASGNNGRGIAGINWRARIIAVKFLDIVGSGSVAGAIASLEYALWAGARVTCNSWGTSAFSQALLDAINAAGEAGQLFVTAAGNLRANLDVSPFYPAAYASPHIISVAASDAADAIASFSSYGPQRVDLAAPGVDIVSTEPRGVYLPQSGTSLAAAHVAGVCGLVMARHPEFTHLEVKQRVLSGVDIRPSLIGTVRTNGRLNAQRALLGPDAIAPGAIRDLRIADPGSNTMGLAWTAPGDDGDVGRADRYEIRHSTAPITESNFGEGPVLNGPFPGVAGTPERFEVGGLAFSTRYYFAIRAVDRFENRGPISENAIGTTLGAPRIAGGPAVVRTSLLTGARRTERLTLTNSGEGTLDFTIPLPRMTALRAFPGDDVAAGGAGGRDAGAGAESAGGPDAFGYQWIDSDEPGGPTFEWVDITGVGRRLSLRSDDALSEPVEMGMRFPFYGSVFESLRVCTNGFLSFTDLGTQFENLRLPTPAAPGNLVAPFWEDLDFGPENLVYTHHDGFRFIVSWVGVRRFSSGGPYTFQVLLYPSGEIRYQYLSMRPPRDGATVGIQNGAGTVGLTVAFDSSYVRDSLAVRITTVPPWLTVSPTAGRIRAGEFRDIHLQFDATGLGAVDLGAEISVLNNDPAKPVLRVPAALHVVPAPDIAVAPTAVAFDSVVVGDSATRSLAISNRGVLPLEVRAVTSDRPAVTVSPTAFVVPPGAFRTLQVRFRPTAPGPVAGRLTILNNDFDAYSVEVSVTGFAMLEPALEVSPESLCVSLPTNGTTSRLVRVANVGGGNLTFSVGQVQAAGAAEAPPADRFVPGSPEAGKGEPDRVFGPAPLRRGGPDTFGYTYTDSSEPDGPPFQWIDVRSTGIAIPMIGDDVNSGPFPIGFGFPFYQAVFDSFRICTNGFVSFTSSLTTFINTSLPNAGPSAPANLLAVMWDDLNFVTPRAFYHSDGARLVIQYQDVPRLGEVQGNTFEIVLYADGTIVYQYLAIRTPLPNSATVGIQNAQRNDGLQVVFNAPYLRDSLSVRFRPPSRFFSVSPLNGTVPGGSSVDLRVTLDATRLPGGVYRGAIRLLSNDPVRPVVDVPVRLAVESVPDLSVSSTSLAFGTVFLGFPAERALAIRNIGSQPLAVTGVASSDPAYRSSVNAVTLAPGDSVVARVSFDPGAVGPHPATLTIASNDPDSPELVIALSGAGAVAPAAAAQPSALAAAVAPTLGPAARQALRPVVLANTGGSDLVWEAVASVVVTAGADAAVAIGAPEEPLDVQPPKGDPGRPGGAVVAASGGPDAFGYRWSDSDEPGGPPFSWADITGVGTRIDFRRDDQNSGPIPLPFPFTFYGTSFDRVRVCTNGWLSFTSGDTTYHNVGLPNAGTRAPENLVAPFWDDLDFRTAGNVYHHYDGSKFIVSFVDVPRWIHAGPAPGIYTFQVLLHPDGQIDFQYLRMQGLLTSATVGIQNATKSIGLQVVYNAPYVHDGLRVRLTRLVEWLSVSPVSGVTPAGGTDTLRVRFDGNGLEDGDYTGTVRVATNDPLAPSVQVRADVHVGVATAGFRLDPLDPTLDPAAGWIAGRIVPPNPCAPGAIVPGSVRVAGLPVAAGSPVRLEDCAATFYFPRMALLGGLGQGFAIAVEAIGEVAEVTWFRGRDTIRILRPALDRPADPYEAGAVVPLSWTDAAGAPPSRYALRYSPDGGSSWITLARDETGRTLAWTVPNPGTTAGFLELVARDASDGAYVGTTYSGPFVVVGTATAAPVAEIPERLGLSLAGPNPARGGVRLELAVPGRGAVEAGVYDVRGALVRRLARGAFEPGRHLLRWDGLDAAGHPAGSGVYFVRATADGRSVNRRVVVIR